VKKMWALWMAVVLVVSVLAPALAAELRARIKAVNVDKGCVTVVEGGKDYQLAANADTKFINVVGGTLVNGIKSRDLRAGRRVVVNYADKDGKLALASLRLRK